MYLFSRVRGQLLYRWAPPHHSRRYMRRDGEVCVVLCDLHLSHGTLLRYYYMHSLFLFCCYQKVNILNYYYGQFGFGTGEGRWGSPRVRGGRMFSLSLSLYHVCMLGISSLACAEIESSSHPSFEVYYLLPRPESIHAFP